MTRQKRNEIIIAGTRFALASDDVTVITYEDPGGMSFPAKYAEVMAAQGSPLFGDRIIKGSRLTTMDHLAEHVHQVLLHTDLTSDAAGCFRALVGRGLSTHFMIDWDGVIYQGLDVMQNAYHAADANPISVGVDLNNRMRNLVREPVATAYPEDHPRVAEMNTREFRRPRSSRMTINGAKVMSYGYTDAQYLALIELLKELNKHLTRMKKPACPFDAKGEIIPSVLDDPFSVDGFVAHWHHSASRWDPGPGFDWQRVFHALGSEHNSFPIELEKGKNIRSLLNPDKVKEYAEEYFVNAESQEKGGWYPIGINQTWHGGVHLSGTCGMPVRAMFDGVVVAARFAGLPTKLGHNNFILLKHSVPIPGKSKHAQPKEFIFYSLYMHLVPMELEKDKINAESPKWLKAIHRLDAGETEAREAILEGEGDDEGDDDEYLQNLDEDDPFLARDMEVVGDVCDPGQINFDSQAWLGLGNHLAALLAGDVAKIEHTDRPIFVSSNEVIGYMGMFGEPGYWQPQIHVEVFADPKRNWKEAIDIGIHGRHLVELDDDVGNDLFVENTDILSLFQGSRRRNLTSLVSAKSVPASDIQYLYTTRDDFIEEKRFLRKVVARHISEWSDRVDWIQAISESEGWDDRISDFRRILRGSALGQEAIQTILPWTWLSRDVAEHIGLDVSEWNGILDHFHPIQFLVWLTYHSTQRVQVVSQGKSKRQLEKQLEEERKRIESGDLLEGERGEYGASFIFDQVPDYPLDEVLQRWWDGWDQGEWKRVVQDEF